MIEDALERGRAYGVMGSIGWPHAHVYVLPCGHGVMICSSQLQSELVHVIRVPAVFFA